jgi:dipeptidase E
MNLLLTSAGFTNQTIIDALADLTNLPLNKSKVSFIPTAANMEDVDKGWLVDDLDACRKIFKSIDIVDFSALPKEVWLPRLQGADVIVVGGGHTGHLMRTIHSSEFANEVRDLFKNRIYVGISAGSMVAGPQLNPNDVSR